ncbi:CENP-Q, a CENPA-CAD centromere complex subunit-domain-containing protein [Rhypophila decipiens]|uniref:CENP-Q, a CENPA-CAD centromere complex subunit-domain-containing protein n=1 Tax=Rhypophila decipiens TaxID=261697 RepID=A0AAN6XVV9_9PEZI|nr:CENP-Q, a CENPA-CAD centromere complex subunit-domain-containing protein [Rhypophila decipiens]
MQPPEAPNQKRRRGRPSIASNNNESASDAPPATQTAMSQSETQVDEASSNPKKRGRPTRSQPTVPDVEDAQPAKGKGIGQSGTREDEGSSNPKKRGRPTKSQDTVPEVQDAPPAKEDGRGQSGTQENEGSSNPKKRESTNKTPPQPKPRPNARVKPEVPKYRHLAPKTRQIPRSTIAAKWTPLDEGSISVVDSIISDASRAVLHRLRDREKHREQAETVLNAFSRRLHLKLIKGIPFPPASRTVGSSAAASAGSQEAELDFDRVMGAIKAVEGTLDPLSHSVALLTREKEKEEAALEADYKRLRRLKSNMRDETKKWIEHAKREHPLVPEKQQNVELVGGDFDEKDLLDDEELTALALRIGRHMNSMKSNLAQIDGVLPAINKSKASLQGVLYSYLDPELYEEVLFGKKEKKGAVET